MTETEAALQAAIDANPLTGLRMILADHLDEIGDARADGYRVLDLLGRWPKLWELTYLGYYVTEKTWASHRTEMSYVNQKHWLSPHWAGKGGRYDLMFVHSRRVADDNAARQWAELPEESRREVLAMVKAG